MLHFCLLFVGNSKMKKYFMITANIFILVDLRLVNGGSHPRQGRVEIKINGIWGTICDDGFDDRDAAVICSMLGFNR